MHNKQTSLWLYLLSLLYNGKLFNTYEIWTIYEIIKSYDNSFLFFFHYKQQGRFWNTLKHLRWDVFAKKVNSLRSFTIFAKKLHHRLFLIGFKYGFWQYRQKIAI